MSPHVIRYDGVDHPVTPDMLADVFRGVNQAVSRQPNTAFVQRIDEIQDGTSIILFFGLGVGLTFRTTTALAVELTEDRPGPSASPVSGGYQS